MNPTETQANPGNIELPATAPLVRVTAGVGSAGQKTWNLRRPVTLIGSRRPAHIVLHDRDISAAHCVIVNTGTEVLLKDLHTSKGTVQNRERIDLVSLSDGDVVTVGNTKIQVAIRMAEEENEDSGCGTTFVEPTRMPEPLTLQLEHTDRTWRIEDAVILLGRHADAAVRIDHEDITPRHAVLFRLGDGPAIYDLGSRLGISVNGTAATIARLESGDRIGIGPCTISVHKPEPPQVQPQPAADQNAVPMVPELTGEAAPPPRGPAESDGGRASGHPLDRPDHPQTAVAGPIGMNPLPTLAQIGADINALHTNIAESWERLNEWRSRLLDNENELQKRHEDLKARTEELDARDAALRGHLHDVTQYSEQIAAREKELAAQLAKIQEERDQANKLRTDITGREEELARRTEEVKRREHVVAQRWARLLSANCPHCNQPLRGMSGPAEAAS